MYSFMCIERAALKTAKLQGLFWVKLKDLIIMFQNERPATECNSCKL